MGAPPNIYSGQLIDVGGHRIYLECAGEGTPTVVFENGAGSSLEEWAIIAPEVARFASVCVYDRAGIGRSDPSTSPIDARTMVQDLHAALRGAGCQGPYVLVGHSLGGVLIRVFTHLYPDEVVGLVFVDSSHPEQQSRLPIPWYARALTPALRILPLIARLNVPGYAALMRKAFRNDDFPPEAVARSIEYATSVPHVTAVVREVMAVDDVLAQGRMVDGLGDRPIAVLSAGTGPKQIVPAIQVLHRELAALSSRSTHRIVDGAAHVSIVTNREYALTVVDAIRAVYDQVQTTPPSS